MEPPFRIKITETDGRIFPLHLLRKKYCKIWYKTYLIHSKTMPNFLEKKILAPYLCTKFILYVVGASGI